MKERHSTSGTLRSTGSDIATHAWLYNHFTAFNDSKVIDKGDYLCKELSSHDISLKKVTIVLFGTPLSFYSLIALTHVIRPK